MHGRAAPEAPRPRWEIKRRESGSGRTRWRGSRSGRTRLPVGRPLVVQRKGSRRPCEERLQNFGNSRRRRGGSQIAVRDAAFPVLGRGAVLFFVVVWMRVPVMVLFERFVKHLMGKRRHIETQQPKRTGKHRPVCSSSGHAQLPTSRPWWGCRRYCTRQVAHSQQWLVTSRGCLASGDRATIFSCLAVRANRAQ